MSGLTLGSLFDGSGGFPLAGLQHGITPVLACEIETWTELRGSARSEVLWTLVLRQGAFW